MFGGPYPGFTATSAPGETDKELLVATHLKVFQEQVWHTERTTEAPRFLEKSACPPSCESSLKIPPHIAQLLVTRIRIANGADSQCRRDRKMWCDLIVWPQRLRSIFRAISKNAESSHRLFLLINEKMAISKCSLRHWPQVPNFSIAALPSCMCALLRIMILIAHSCTRWRGIF